MKKIFALIFALSMILATSMAFACTGPGCVETASATAIASPFYTNGSSNPWGNATGGWMVGAGGSIGVDAFAQGTKSATATAWANGDAFGFGCAAGIQTPHFGLGASGAFSAVALEGAGFGLGIDKLSFFKNPDFAYVGISYSGQVVQSNGINVNNGSGTGAGAGNETGATFQGGSYVESNGNIGRLDFAIPALAVNADAAGAYAGGFSKAGYVDFTNFAAACSKTVGFSGYFADSGSVYGTGMAGHQAMVNNNGNFGLSAGQATFCYSGNGSFGAGMAETSGWTKITTGPVSSSVTSFSTSSASAGVK